MYNGFFLFLCVIYKPGKSANQTNFFYLFHIENVQKPEKGYCIEKKSQNCSVCIRVINLPLTGHVVA